MSKALWTVVPLKMVTSGRVIKGDWPDCAVMPDTAHKHAPNRATRIHIDCACAAATVPDVVNFFLSFFFFFW
jgi:hypothetical protein